MNQLAMRQARPNLRQVKKEATAAHFKDVARELFNKYGYHEVSVEAIAREAGASRAAFYLHYRNKVEVLRSFLHDDLQGYLLLYDKLVSQPHINPKVVRAWLVDFRAHCDSQRPALPLYHIAFTVAFEGGSEMQNANRDAIIEKLGKRFPAFNLHGLPRAARARRRAAAFAILFMIERVVMNFSAGPASPSIDDGLDYLTEQFIAFTSACY
jgi:AcrR family transcriptional regulator